MYFNRSPAPCNVKSLAFEVLPCRSRDLAEAVDDGVEAIMVPPGDADALAKAIASLKNDDALRVRMGKAGRERAQNLAEPNTCARFLQAFSALVAFVSNARNGSCPACSESLVIESPSLVVSPSPQTHVLDGHLMSREHRLAKI